MKNLVILVLVGIVAVLLFRVPSSLPSSEQDAPRNPVDTASVIKPDGSPPVEIAPKLEAIKEDPEIFNPDGTLRKLPSNVKYWNFWGRIEQHLGGGYLLVSCAGKSEDKRAYGGRYALLGLPEIENLPDGEWIRFAASIIGTYTYEAIDGSSVTVQKLLYLPPEALPTPAPGTWRPSALDRPRR
jgi:hypothetical protein